MGGSDSEESAYIAGDLASISRLGRSPEGGHGNPLQYPCLKNPHGQKAWWAPDHGLQRVGQDLATEQQRNLFLIGKNV